MAKGCGAPIYVYGWGGSGWSTCGCYGLCDSCRGNDEEKERPAPQEANQCRHSNYRMTSRNTAVCLDCGNTMGG